MSISIYQDFASESDRNKFTVFSGRSSGWEFTGFSVYRKIDPNEDVITRAAAHVQIPIENRIVTDTQVTFAYHKYSLILDSGLSIIIFLEGDWNIRSNGRVYTCQAGDLVISKMPLEVTNVHRMTRWSFISQSIQDKILSAQDLISDLGLDNTLDSDSESDSDSEMEDPVSDDSGDEFEISEESLKAVVDNLQAHQVLLPGSFPVSEPVFPQSFDRTQDLMTGSELRTSNISESSELQTSSISRSSEREGESPFEFVDETEKVLDS